MKVNFIIFIITAFLMANTYYDGKFTEYIMKGKKYYRMATFAFVGLSIYLFINKNPGETKSLVKHATELIKYMPVDNNTRDMLTPLFDFTSARDKVNQYGQEEEEVMFLILFNLTHNLVGNLLDQKLNEVLVKPKKNMLLPNKDGNVICVINN